MIYESSPWKQDLLRRKRIFLSHNTPTSFSKNEDAAYTAIEKSIFYSAFIIRKLIDCGGKLSDEAEAYTLQAKKYTPLKKVDAMHRWIEEDSHDWKHPKGCTVNGKDICNWLIHSYIFCLCHAEDMTVYSFLVSSDYDRSKALYEIKIADWFAYVDFIASDDVVSLSAKYDEDKQEYMYTKKVRGKR